MDINKLRSISIWDSDYIYEESLMFVKDKNGKAYAPLMFDPSEIISVKDSCGNHIYTENIDWYLEGNIIFLTDNSSIFFFEENELYPQVGQEGKSFKSSNGYILFNEGKFFISRQIAVTYKCNLDSWKGIKPVLADDKLKNTFNKLKNKQAFKFTVYGDSISFGANTTKNECLPPFQPCYGEMLYEALTEEYGDFITYANVSHCGWDTVKALEFTEERVNTTNPDLVILAFGMNDGQKTKEQFKENTLKIISTIRNKNPLCEFILVATTLPNPLLTTEKAHFYASQEEFIVVLKEIEQTLNGIAVADITAMHKYILTKKRFIDLTSNNVNHPNDFLYRCQYNFLREMLIPKEKFSDDKYYC